MISLLTSFALSGEKLLPVTMSLCCAIALFIVLPCFSQTHSHALPEGAPQNTVETGTVSQTLANNHNGSVKQNNDSVEAKRKVEQNSNEDPSESGKPSVVSTISYPITTPQQQPTKDQVDSGELLYEVDKRIRNLESLDDLEELLSYDKNDKDSIMSMLPYALSDKLELEDKLTLE